MKILLAMSGGVDSSVVAHLLREQGHDILGVRFTLWSDPLAPALAQVLPSKCCTTQNIARASTVAKSLGIPLHIVNLEDEFKKNVVDPFLEGHKKGLTPNPCIGCNRTIKFGHLLKLKEELGCEKLVTGHYARVAREEMNPPTHSGGFRTAATDIDARLGNHQPPRSGDSQISAPKETHPPRSRGSKTSASSEHVRYLLLEALDKRKDQSYYLYGLSQEQLQSVFFPLGSMLKSEVYALAEHFGIPLPSAYRESQDLCFFPEKTPKAFLKRHLKGILSPGEIIRRDGSVVGTHEGLPLYTIGQRRGLKIGGLAVPLEVVEKQNDTNRLIVAPKGTETREVIELSDLKFVSWIPESGIPVPFECRTRSLSPRRKGELFLQKNNASFRFLKPEGLESPGQSLVLYRGEEVVGGGVIQ